MAHAKTRRCLDGSREDAKVLDGSREAAKTRRHEDSESASKAMQAK